MSSESVQTSPMPGRRASGFGPAWDDEVVIAVRDLGKIYHLYDKPIDRLKQAFLWGRKKLFREFWALKGINLEVKRGEVLGLIGRNGSGKSTLLQIVCGVLKPSAGVAEVKGRVAALLELGSGFNPDFTGRENVFMNGAILGLSREQIDQRYEEIVRFAEIGEFIDQPVKTYSSGMVVRLAFSIAVHVDAEVLVVDEALSVGDVAFQFKCLYHLESLLERGVTILLVSHDVQLVKGYCTRALYLKNNAMEYYGDCETATEMYLKDMRDQKAKMLEAVKAEAEERPQTARPHAEKGEILSVRVGCGEEERRQFFGGERVWVEVVARVSAVVRSPRLTLFVRDLKGYGLFGFNNHYGNVTVTPDSDGIIRGRFSFNCALQIGDYSIALRLEECMGESLTMLIDKHLNALNFKVVTEVKSFLGVVDLGGSFEELPSKRTMASIA